MPRSWAMVDSNFPTFTGDEKPKDQINMLVDYMFVLVEELKFQLENLDSSNWNSTALESFQTDTTEDVTKQVAALTANLAMVTNEVAAISARVSTVESLTGRMKQVEEDLSYLQKDLKEFIAKMQDVIQIDEATGAVTIGQEGVDLKLVGNIYINGNQME